MCSRQVTITPGRKLDQTHYFYGNIRIGFATRRAVPTSPGASPLTATEQRIDVAASQRVAWHTIVTTKRSLDMDRLESGSRKHGEVRCSSQRFAGGVSPRR